MSKFGLTDVQYETMLSRFKEFNKKFDLEKSSEPETKLKEREAKLNAAEAKLKEREAKLNAAEAKLGDAGAKLEDAGANTQVRVKAVDVRDEGVESPKSTHPKIDVLFTFLKETPHETIKKKLDQILSILNNSAPTSSAPTSSDSLGPSSGPSSGETTGNASVEIIEPGGDTTIKSLPIET